MKKRRILLFFASLAVCLSMLHMAAFAQSVDATLSGDCMHDSVDINTGKCENCGFQYAAKVAGSFFETYESAFLSVHDMDTVTLYKELLPVDLYTHDNTIYLNLNGKNLNGGTIYVEDGGCLVLQNYYYDNNDSLLNHDSGHIELDVSGTLSTPQAMSPNVKLQLTVFNGSKVYLRGGHITKDIEHDIGVTHDDLLDDGYCYRVYNDGVLGDFMKAMDSSLHSYDLAIEACEHPGYSGSGICEYCNYKPIQLKSMSDGNVLVYSGKEQVPNFTGYYLDDDSNDWSDLITHGINCTVTADPTAANGAASAIYPGTYTSIITLKGRYYDIWKAQDWSILKATIAKEDEPAALTANVYNTRDDSWNKYEVDLSALLPKLDENCEYGNISYSIAQYPTAFGYTFTKAEVSDSGVLTLNTDTMNDYSYIGQIATMKVKVTTDNYNDFYFVINIVAKDVWSTDVNCSVSSDHVEYGDVFTITATQTSAPDGGTWTWEIDTDFFEIVDGAGTATVTLRAKKATAPHSGAIRIYYTCLSHEGNRGCNVSVYKKSITKPTQDATVYIYTGDEQTYSVADSSYYTVSGNKRTAAGSQKVVISLNDKDNYEWSDGTTDDIEYTFTVNKAKAVINVDTTPIVVTYGDSVTLPTATTNFGTVACDKTPADLVNANTYTVTYTVQGTENYDGDTKTLSVTVNPKAITKPAEDTTVYTYTGNEQTYSVADSSYYTVSGNKRTDAGSQKVVISLNDKSNYEWNDGTTDDIEYTFTVNKAKAVITVDTTPIVVTYGDAVTLPTATTNFGTVACDKTPADLVNANPYVVTYTVVGTENYDGDTKTLSVTVNPKRIAIPAEDTTVYTYTGDEQTYSVADSTYYTVSDTKRTAAGSQKVVISLNDKNNYEWNDGTTDDIEYTFTVKKAQPIQKAATTARIPVGKALENAETEYGEFAAVDGKTVLEGVFEWTDGKQKVNASTTVTMRFTPNDGNYATIEFDVAITAYVPYSGNGISSTTTVKEGDIITLTTVNDDGSVTVTVKNTATGTTTETTTYTDGSMTKLETRKDGTKISVKRDKNGDVAAEIQAATEVEIKIPISNATDVTKIIVTDKNGTKTEITKFTITADGVKFTTSASGSVKFVVGTEKKEFIDVHTVEHWATEDIDYVYAKGLMMGTSEDTFEPDEPLTRGMAVTILYRAEGEPAVNKSRPFADVSADDYYADAVIWAQQNEIVNGVSENEFAPNENITREQFATIIYRYACYKGVAPTGAWAIRLTYADVAEISDYAAEGVMYCKLKEIMNGKGENMFAPSDNTTRAEAAAIFHRFLEIDE